MSNYTYEYMILENFGVLPLREFGRLWREEPLKIGEYVTLHWPSGKPAYIVRVLQLLPGLVAEVSRVAGGINFDNSWADQYNRLCVEIPQHLLSKHISISLVDIVMEYCVYVGAYKEVEAFSIEYCVEFPGRFPEMYTEQALRRSIDKLST